MSEESVNKENPGKGLGVTGFIIAIVMLVFGFWITAMLAAAMGMAGAIIGILIIVAGLILSVMGRKKSKAAGFGTGLATTGMVLSIVNLGIWIIILAFFGSMIFAVSTVDQGELDDWADDMQEQLDEM